MEKCLRCEAGFDNPVPKVTNPEGGRAEIACIHWCPKCNAIAMSVLFREQCVYQVLDLKSTTGARGFSGMPKVLR